MTVNYLKLTDEVEVTIVFESHKRAPLRKQKTYNKPLGEIIKKLSKKFPCGCEGVGMELLTSIIEFNSNWQWGDSVKRIVFTEIIKDDKQLIVIDT